MKKQQKLTADQSQEAFNYLMKGDHQLIVYGVLKRLNITKNHSQYDDLVQEGWLAFIKAYYQYPKPKRTKAHLNYIYQGVKWQLINYLNRVTNQSKHIDISDDEHDPLNFMPDPTTEDDYYPEMDFLYYLYQHCDQNERKYIRGVYDDLSVLEMAYKYQVARKTVYSWRRRVMSKAKRLYKY
ncbi:DNA-directed RNA polymerase sigma-70 factor [Philodulcilactobacillus myokoensis]|uniref:DNA-directed RNA polymerase sigma-70 factor n=1 Tax=Philodulcilactobacillus myokoensis TaxID=2929573 RepID=A0A9W6B3U2_9LACO|nr:sigma-70 family RNA polymerase sigma factor [Philodulcilactobacillus myokoensis]GLB47279.1 DNA-directed RNA polymerase sigma-70 factor [Philodulcilactobacillus myokoensis]